MPGVNRPAGARISLCMIVKNEARALPSCLSSTRPWVDEIVVVDTGSTDDTREIARSFGAQLVEWAWRDDFAAARNESLRHATGDWILVLDADETLSDGAGTELRAACATAPADVVAYLVKIVCPRDGDGGLVRLNWFPRLFRKLPGVQFEGVIHEQVIGSLAGRGQVERSKIEVLHGGYTLSADQIMAKARRNLGLLERQLRQDPSYAPGWFQIAETYVLLGKMDDAIDAYRRCLKVLETSRLTLPPSVIAVALQNLGAALIARGDRTDGVKALEAALVIVPDLPPVHVHLGGAAITEQRWEDAELHFADALSAIERAGDLGEYEASPWLIYFLRGCAQARQAKLSEAIASFDRALELNPRHGESLWLLALSTANSGAWERSLGALDRLHALGRSDFPFYAQRALAFAMLGRPEQAAHSALTALEYEPTSAPMLALGADNLARLGRTREAADLYARVSAAMPESVAPLLALAQCRETLGDLDGMMEAYRRAVALAPEAPDVLFALGSACLRAGALDVAEECLASAVEHDATRADYRLNHALCLLKQGAAIRASRVLSGILERWPTLSQARELHALANRLVELEQAATHERTRQ